MTESGPGCFKHSIDRSGTCQGCEKCIAACPRQAVRLAGREMSVSEVMDVALEDSSFYWTSGGGITIGGGEPTLQPEFTGAILAAAKAQGLHTAVETCGFTSWEILSKLSEHTNLFLYDLKHISSEKHQELTGVHNEPILRNLSSLLENGSAVTIRLPLITGKNDQLPHLEQTMLFLKKLAATGARLQGIEVLPYHRLGHTKYSQLDAVNPLAGSPGYAEETLVDIELYLRSFDLPVNVVRM